MIQHVIGKSVKIGSYTTMTFPAKHINNSFVFLFRAHRTERCTKKYVQLDVKIELFTCP